MGKSANRRAREKQERRDAILDAAARVFGERGPANTTMEEVAEAAEVSKGTVYLYFKSKDDLLVALSHRPLAFVLERFSTLLDEGEATDGRTLLEQLIEAHTNVMMNNEASFRLAIATMSGELEPAFTTESATEYGQRVEILRSTYHDTIRRGMRDGSLRADLDPMLVAGSLWASMMGAMFLRVHAPKMRERLQVEDKLDFDAVMGSVTQLLMRALANGGER